MSMRRMLVGVAAVSLLAGCVGPQNWSSEPVTAYRLQAVPVSAAPTKTGVVLLVAAPRAHPGYDTERMAYVRTPNQLEYFVRSRWIDAPARMLAPLLAQALEAGGAFAGVVQAPTVARTQWRLETEVVKLEQDFLVQPSRIQIVLRAQLIDVATQQPAAAKVFSVTVPAQSEDARGGVQAANEAVAQLLPQLAQWCASTLAPAARR